MNLKLIKFNNDTLKEYNFLQLMKPENGFTNDAYGISYDEYLNKKIPAWTNMANSISLPEGYVPSTKYFLYDEDTIVGVFNIRHYLNKFLMHHAGHIGYGIGLPYRKKGYATEGLKLAIEELKKIPSFEGNEIFISCNQDNVGSLKVQLKNGAYIHHEEYGEYMNRIPVNKNNSLIEIVVATGNEHKMQEYKEMFSMFHNIKLTSMKEENINVDIIEDGKTFKENSLIKAQTVAKYTNKFVLADDSGLEIDALDGFPGIYSARFKAGEPYPNKWQAIIEMLNDKDNREAQFHCVLTLINPYKEVMTFEGIERGSIIKEIKGYNGFGYDPIFFSNTLNKTFGEASEEEKNKVSHRGRAFEQLKDYIIENL